MITSDWLARVVNGMTCNVFTGALNLFTHSNSPTVAPNGVFHRCLTKSAVMSHHPYADSDTNLLSVLLCARVLYARRPIHQDVSRLTSPCIGGSGRCNHVFDDK